MLEDVCNSDADGDEERKRSAQMLQSKVRVEREYYRLCCQIYSCSAELSEVFFLFQLQCEKNGIENVNENTNPK